MKIYVQTDIEGVAGFCFRENRANPSEENVRHRYRMYQLLTDEVNAAVRAAFDSGADEVIVNDNHGSGYNILFEQLDPRCPHYPRAQRKRSALAAASGFLFRCDGPDRDARDGRNAVFDHSPFEMDCERRRILFERGVHGGGDRRRSRSSGGHAQRGRQDQCGGFREDTGN